jgi:hypothetical protein
LLRAGAAQSARLGPRYLIWVKLDKAFRFAGGDIVYVQRLHVSEFRCFRDATIEFNYPGRFVGGDRVKLPNVTLLLGNNAAGKSTVMKAIAWGGLAQVMAGSGLLPRMFVRRTETMPPTKNASVTADVILHDQELGSASNPISRKSQGVVQLVQNYEQFVSSAITDADSWQPIFDEQSPAFFIVGYGATRRSESSSTADPSYEKPRSIRYQRVASIFEDQVALASTSVAFSRINTLGRGAEAADLLNRLLPEDVRVLAGGPGEPNEFQAGGIRLLAVDLSDGYRAFVAWTLDLLYHLSQVAPPNSALTDLRGVVLIDEIDLHLHPKWQRVVVNSVATAFPNLQFVISSHSPLVAGSLEFTNILVAESNSAGEPTFARGTARVHGLTSDQILTSDYFGLATTRAVEMSTELHELAHAAWSGDFKASAKYLRTLARGLEEDTDSGDPAS